MLIDKDMKIKISPNNKRFFLDYEIDKNGYITINQKDLSPRSTYEVYFGCDECGKEFKKRRRDYNSGSSTFCGEKCRKINNKKAFDKKREERKDLLKKDFIKRINEGKSIKYSDIYNENRKMIYDIERLFGSISNISQEVGITREQLVNEYGLRNIVLDDSGCLSYEEVKRRVFYLSENKKLNTAYSRREFSDGQRLERSMKTLFGSFENGISHFGLERDIYSTNELIEAGRKFQDLTFKSFKAMKYGFDYEKGRELNTIFPDFVFNNDVWIDTKLSSWTISIENTIEKYSPHCKRIIILYLRGNTRTDLVSEKVGFLKIDEIYPYLRNIKREDLINEFEELKIQLSA